MSAPAEETLIAEVAALCAGAERILFITGAGISADSGLPTYRGIGGLYNDAATNEGWAIEDALSGTMLRTRPAVTWKYLAQIEATCRGAQPNAAHEIIAGLENSCAVTVLTQNVDGLHRAAGSSDLIEIHGSLHRLICTHCGYAERVADYADLTLPPDCPECDGMLRPDVVLFGEALAERSIERLIHTLDRGVDLVFSIGTTSVFPYIAEPVFWAREAGIPTVEINPGTSQVSEIVDYRLRLGAAVALKGIHGWLGAL
jgi:NAD-dependent deacetylase